MTTTCELCERPTDGTACRACADRTAAALHRAATLVHDAAATAARQARTGADGGPDPMPIAWEATNALWAAVNTITTWARHVAETRGCPGPGTVCTCHLCQISRCGALAATATWVATQVEWIRHRPEAVEVLDELDDACALIERTADRPPERWYAGPCWTDTPAGRCEEQLHARSAAGTVHCRACGTRHDVTARRAWLLSEAGDQLAPATDLARALTTLGQKVTPSQIRGWAHRGLIVAHGWTVRGDPTYRVSEVRATHADVQARRYSRANRLVAP